MNITDEAVEAAAKVIHEREEQDRGDGTLPDNWEVMSAEHPRTRAWCLETARAALEAFILAAGYSKPRTITTAEELDGLPVRATILDRNDHVWTNDGDCKDQWGSVTLTESHGGPKWAVSADIELPATVLYDAVAK